MVRTQIYLTESEQASLRALAHATGKTQSELIRMAIDRFLEEPPFADRGRWLQRGRGIWKDREDLPDFHRLRQEWDRF